jgi:hypothetical protein
MIATGIIMDIGLIIAMIAIITVYVLWIKSRHKHPSKSTVD